MRKAAMERMSSMFYPYLICVYNLNLWNNIKYTLLEPTHESSSSEENEKSDDNEEDDEHSDDFDRPKAKRNVKGVCQSSTTTLFHILLANNIIYLITIIWQL
jgi:hypothetical protein